LRIPTWRSITSSSNLHIGDIDVSALDIRITSLIPWPHAALVNRHQWDRRVHRDAIFHATSKRVRDLPHHAGQIALKRDSDDHAMGASL
jgi:hypothetical protein